MASYDEAGKVKLDSEIKQRVWTGPRDKEMIGIAKSSLSETHDDATRASE